MLTVLGLLFVGSLNLAAPRAVQAEPSNFIEISGDGVANPTTFTLDQLQAMEQYQHVYSTINTWPTKKWYVGRGVKLRYLLDLAGIKEEAQLITFTSNDGYTVTLTVKELLKDKRYYFPHFKDNDASDGSIPGSPADAKEVEPILALVSTEGSNNPDDMNDRDALLLMCGQRAVTEQTNNIFLKYIQKVEVATSAPPKWDNPRANISTGEVPAGTLIELSNKRNDSDKIHYTTDGSTPTVNSPVFNWSAKRWWGQRPDSLKNINKPLEITKDTIIKARTIGPGREDSDVVTFSYRVGASSTGPKPPGGPPTGVTLDQDMINLKVGGTFELEAIVGPENASDKRVTWSSSDTRVATVDNHGLVTVVGPGTATITAKTVVGDLVATCIVKSGEEDNGGQIAAAPTRSKNDEKEEAAQPEIQEDKQQYLAAKEEIPPDASEPVAEEPAKTDEANNSRDEQEVSQVPEENQRYLAPKEVMAASHSEISSPPDSKDGRIWEVSVDTISLPPPVEQGNLRTYTLPIFMLLFLSGAGKRYREYAKEVAR